MGSALPDKKTISCQRKSSSRALITMGLIMAGLVPLKAAAGLEILYEQTFQTNANNITSDLWVKNVSFGISLEMGSLYQQNIPTDLAGRGCVDIHSGWTEWQYQTTETGMSIMFKVETVGWHLIPGWADSFYYTIPSNKVVGWENVNAEMVAPVETAPFVYTVPLTRSTTTHTNGVSLGALVDSGLATNGSSRAEFESAAVIDVNSNNVPDAIDWLVGGNTNYVGGLSASIATTNGSPLIFWSPAVSNRIYTIYSKTNLTETGWAEFTIVTNDAGSADSYSITNDLSSAFFKVDVSLP